MLIEHTSGCAACQEFLVQALEQERDLDAMLQVPVNPELRSRVFAEAISGPRRSRRQAIAAGLALGVAIGTGSIFWRDDPLALAGIDFVVFEEAQAILDAGPADRSALDRVVQRLGMMTPEHLGEIHYVGTCPFGGGMAHHVVVKTARGKVTLLLMPDHPIEKRLAARARGLESVIAPLRGGGVAIVAASARSLERIENMLKAA